MNVDQKLSSSQLIKKIGDNFLDALYFLNQYGFSIETIEHFDNMMINTKTYNIKLIDIDEISRDQFSSTKEEMEHFEDIFVSREYESIPTSNFFT